MDGKYLTFHHNGTMSSITIQNNPAHPQIQVGEKWIKAYKDYFHEVVNYLRQRGCPVELAEDLCQEGFIKLQGVTATSNAHFRNIWQKRCLYDFGGIKKQKNYKEALEENTALCFQPSIHEDISKFCKTYKQARIIQLVQMGLLQKDISKLTGLTYAQVTCLYQRGLKEIRKKLKNEIKANTTAIRYK